MACYNQYDKNVIEKFAIETISKSYNTKYAKYVSPSNTDNFDFISEDLKSALEVTTAIPNNMFEAYKYEKERIRGKSNLSIKKIDGAKTNEKGELFCWSGGTMLETQNKIIQAINKKQDKAIKRIQASCVEIVDLCICLQDGSLYDLESFRNTFHDFNEYIFENIFFITPSYFIHYDRNVGFQEFTLRI